MCVRFVCACIAQANKLFSMLYALITMLLPGPDLHRAGPPALWEFRNIFRPNTGENQKSRII